MSILQATNTPVGLVGVVPNVVYINTNDTAAAVLTTGYLTSLVQSGGITVSSSTMVLVNTTSGAIWGAVAITGTAPNYIYSMAAPTYAGPATFAGNVVAGSSGTPGHFISYPTTATSGTLNLTAVNNTGNTVTTISNVAMGQASTISIPDPGSAAGRFLVANTATPFTSGNFPVASGTGGLMVDGPVAANRVLTSAISTPDVSIDLVRFDVTCGQAALAAAGHVTLLAGSGAKQYKIISLWTNLGGTNFSGGSTGDRLGQVSDGTTVYSVIPAASLQTLANAVWGSTAMAFPASAALNTSTAAGASLYFAYSGGSVDYTAGSVVISGILQRVV